MSWHLRSIADHDTHRGELRGDGTVLALCGVTFRPRQLPFGRAALPGEPPDLDQICPTCYRSVSGATEITKLAAARSGAAELPPADTLDVLPRCDPGAPRLMSVGTAAMTDGVLAGQVGEDSMWFDLMRAHVTGTVRPGRHAP